MILKHLCHLSFMSYLSYMSDMCKQCGVDAKMLHMSFLLHQIARRISLHPDVEALSYIAMRMWRRCPTYLPHFSSLGSWRWQKSGDTWSWLFPCLPNAFTCWKVLTNPCARSTLSKFHTRLMCMSQVFFILRHMTQVFLKGTCMTLVWFRYMSVTQV